MKRQIARTTAFALLVLTGVASAAPLPPERPDRTAAADTPPLPDPRPDAAKTETTPAEPIGPKKPEVTPPSPEAAKRAEPPPAKQPAGPAAVRNLPTDGPAPTTEQACRTRLDRLDVVYTGKDRLSEGECGIEDPVEVTRVAGVAVDPPALLNCPAAEGLARWVGEVVIPEAETRLKARPTAIANASAYVCRPRNGREGAKLSEHATGNAVDVSAVTLSGRPPVSVVDDPSQPEATRAFLKAVRTAACAYFTTVLGPGADEDHGDHFHLDLQARDSGYRLCE